MCFSYITGWWFGTCLLFFHDISIISHMIIKKIVFNHVFLIYYWLVVWKPWAQVLPASGAALADPWVVRFALRLVAPMDKMPPAQAGQSA